LPPDKIVLLFPKKYKGATYAGIRVIARDTMKVELPEAYCKGYVTFDADWQPRTAISEIDFTEGLIAGRPTDLNRNREKPPSAENSSVVDSLSITELLEQLEVNITYPPPFKIHNSVWAAVSLWLILLLGIPGERWSFLLDKFLDIPHFVGSLIEGISIITLAIGLAFIPYIHDPTRRLRSSLVLCAVLVLHSYWIVARTAPN
jgi:hypothetical protein